MGAPFVQPIIGRRINSDGTIDIICSICETTICRQPYRGYSTAICAHCSGELERGKRPEDIIREQLKVEDKQHRDVMDDLGQGRFKVWGLGKRIQEVVQEIRKAATKRRRGKLLENKD